MKKILIIEDEKILAEMYKFKLSKEGFEVFHVMDVDSGIEIAKKEIPNLVLLDILLPKESGINYLIKSKAIKEIASIPVLVLSNFDDQETKSKAFDNGAKDYMIKSNHDPHEIVDKVKKLLS
jgi:two-component system alkaline phosphatase synthesis response regulator PhoP